MKFLSLVPSLSFHPVVFISFVGLLNFSFCLSPPNSRFSLEDQFSAETLVENEGPSTAGTTPISTEFQAEGQQSSSQEELVTIVPNASPIECECGVRGDMKQLIPSDDIVDVRQQEQQPFILNGTEAFRGQFPWLAAVTRHSEFFAPRVICGASLINSKFLLTAAHCIINKRKDRLRLVFNALKISSFYDVRRDEKAMVVKIKRLIPHNKYNPMSVDNDIGLIELEEPFDFLETKGTIGPVCLPASKELDYAGENATVAGWGYTIASGGLNSPTIQKAIVPILSQDSCRKTQYGNQILQGMLCAGFDVGGIDACTNDSGGPLIVEDGKSNILVGIVSWGHSCGLPKLPGVYTRVSEYMNWINLNMKGEENRCKQS